MQMVFEVSEKNILVKILDIFSMKNYILHICFDVTQFEDRIQGSCTCMIIEIKKVSHNHANVCHVNNRKSFI